MKLQEITFMVSLIKANYHRRMLYFWGNVLVIAVALAAIYYSLNSKDDEFFVFICSMFGCVALVRFFIVYIIRPDKFDDDSNFPWVIKKEQMDSLRQHSDAKGEFEDLGCHVPLHEYFEMY